MNQDKVIEVINDIEKFMKEYIKKINDIDYSKLILQEAKLYELINEKLLFIAVIHEKLEEALREE